MTLPIEFLMECSDRSLQDAHLNALNRAANLRTTIRKLTEEMIACESEALAAYWFVEHRSELLQLGRIHAIQKVLDFSCRYVPHRKALKDSAKRLL